MDAERFSQVEELFHRALEREPGNRTDWLAEAAGGDRDLQREVRTLLDAHDNPATLLGEPSGAQPKALDPGNGWIGPQIGPYRLLRLIGNGGSSAVFRAERTDGLYRSDVAIKLLLRTDWHPEWTAAADRGFHRECQILSDLEHPGIARLRDAGTTPEGVPYLVMDYVEGEPIDRYCRRRRLTVEERLRLALEVCSAVDHAHSNLVLHRDIKPGNVLVTPDGRTKLLDFGIATLLGPSPGGDRDPTVPGWRPMTVRYASPEQLRGEPLTTASDVYSLGVLLYQLLTGRLPVYAVEGRPPTPEEEPLRPSAACTQRTDSAAGSRSTHRDDFARQCRTHARRLERQLAGDLDNIVLKALDADIALRYRTVEQLAADLRCHLEERPVSARPAGFITRLTKLARRNRLAAALSGCLLIAVLGYAVSTTWLLGEIVHQRDDAEGERQRATRVSRFLVDLFSLADPAEGSASNLTAVDLLDRGSKQVDGDLEGQPESQALIHDTLGAGYRKLGLYAQARRSFEEALKIRRQLLGEDHPDTLESVSRLGAVYIEQGSFAEAERMLAETEERQRRALPEGELALAETLDHRGTALYRLGRPREAQAPFSEALEIRRRTLGSGHRSVGDSLHQLAMVQLKLGELGAAEKLFREALATIERDVGRRHPETLPTVKSLATILRYGGDLAGAEELFLEVLDTERELYGDEHPRIAFTLNNLGHLYRERGELDRAERYFREGLAIRRRLLGPAHLATLVSTTSLATVLGQRGELAQAEDLYREALATMRRIQAPDSLDLAHILIPLGDLLTRRGSPQRAEGLLREAYSLRRALAPKNPLRAAAASALGACLAALGRHEEAERLLLEGWSSGSSTREERRRAAERLVEFYLLRGQKARAQPFRAFLDGTRPYGPAADAGGEDQAKPGLLDADRREGQ